MDKHKRSELRRLVGKFVGTYLGQFDVGTTARPQTLLERPPGALLDGDVLSFQIDGHGTSIESPFVNEHACRDKAGDVFDALPATCSFSSSDEIFEFLWAQLDAFVVPGQHREASAEAVAEHLVDTMASPPRTWEFSAQVALATENDPVADEIQRSLSEHLSFRDRGPSVRRLMLGGDVGAHTADGAATAGEYLALAFAGAGIAVGLLGHSGRFRADLDGVVELDRAPSHFTPAAHGVLCNLVVEVPRDLSELDRNALSAGNVTVALARHLRLLGKVLNRAGERADVVRNACRRAALAVGSADIGLSVTLAFSVIEGLLLDQDERDTVVGRLSEAVAHALGTSVDERKKLRAATKDLYRLRSSFIHTGRIPQAARGHRHAMELMLAVLRRELDQLS